MKNLKIKGVCFIAAMLCTTLTFGQFSNFYYSNQIPVIKGNDTLSLAWTGGMNHPQFSTLDVDYDGQDELIAYEPGNGLISVFKRKLVGGKVVYSYVYGGANFPSGIQDRLQLFDYNHDGKKDLFTYTTPDGIRVYENVGDAIEGLQWKLVRDQIETTDINNNVSEINTTSKTIPALVDIDGDGDMDILTFAASRKIVEWHKNLSMETYGNPDSLIFKLEQPCWGDFEEALAGNGIVLNSTIPPCGTTQNSLPNTNENGGMHAVNVDNRHLGGGSILALDINGNGMKDLLIGDHQFDNLTLVINGGTDPSANADMTNTDPTFPSYDVPVDLSNFLTAYYEDVDLDSVKDLIVSTTYVNHSNNTDGVWSYKNTGTNENPHFQFVKKDFLQGDMIENGQSSIPVLVDVNNDGLLDLLVANSFNYADSLNTSKIDYYQNVGTSSAPVYKLENENWSGFANSGLSGRVSPTFGDLDGDGDKDMVIGTSSGDLYYYENAGGTNSMLFNIVQAPLKDNQGNPIVVSGGATPELFDLNNDGKLDLIIGQANGPLLYYKNIGTATNYSFQLVNSNLGQISTTNQQYCVPRFYRTNGETYLFTGNSYGTIALYDNVQNSVGVGEIFHLVTNDVAQIDTKKSSAPAIAKIKDDGSYNLLVGGLLGGLWNFTTDSTFLAVKNESKDVLGGNVRLYPNPNNGSFTVDVSALKLSNYKITVFDPVGRVVLSKNNLQQSTIHLHIPSQKSGLYFIKIKSMNGLNRSFIKKMVVH